MGLAWLIGIPASFNHAFRVKVATFKLSAAWRMLSPPDSDVWAG